MPGCATCWSACPWPRPPLTTKHCCRGTADRSIVTDQQPCWKVGFMERIPLIEVDGTVNFATEELDLDIDPESKGLRIFSLRSPLYVRGTFAAPRPGVHAGPLALRGTGMLALGALTP